MRPKDPEHLTVLALDTSSRSTTVALTRGGRMVRFAEAAGDDRRSERLWLDVDELLHAAGTNIHDVDVFGVCVGPGGFTGLRIGLAAAKGFAAATGRPLVGVTSLEAAASGAAALGASALGAAGAKSGLRAESRPVCAMVGAYKGEVYWQVFALDDFGMPVALSEAHVSTSSAAAVQLADLPDVVFVGDAAAAENARLGEVGSRQFSEGGWQIQQSSGSVAEAVARLTWLRARRGELESAEAVRAVYVRPAEAEVKLSLGLLGSKIKRSRL